MDEAEKIRKREAIIQRRIDMDLLTRSLPGIVIYAVLWPIIFIPTEFYRLQPEICWWTAGGLLGFSVIRGVQAKLTNVWYENNERAWLAVFAFCSLMQATIWGYLFFLVVGDPRFEPISFLMVISLGGMASGALSALNPRLWLALTNISLILMPGLVSAIFITKDYSLASIIAIYFVYLLMLGRRSNKEYLRAFRIETQLEAQRLELEKLNKIDPLTMIYNRGHFNATLEFQWNNSIRTKQVLSLLLIDVDHFKSINDRYGHLYGDECLVFIANTIHNTAKRNTDVIARFGGEEFAVLLSHTSQSEAEMLAEEIRRAFEVEPFVFEGIEHNITVSIGLSSVVPARESKANSLIEEADSALYEAKSAGRNRVKAYQAN